MGVTPPNNIVWAGVLIQLDNGSSWAVEIDKLDYASMSLEREPEEDVEFGLRTGWRHYVPGLELHIKVNLEGRGRHAQRWQPPAPPTRTEIEPERKAIES